MNWISIKNKKGEFVKSKLPTDDKIYIFIHWHKKWNTTIQQYIGNMQSVYTFRKYQLENDYTHYCEFVIPK